MRRSSIFIFGEVKMEPYARGISRLPRDSTKPKPQMAVPGSIPNANIVLPKYMIDITKTSLYRSKRSNRSNVEACLKSLLAAWRAEDDDYSSSSDS